ncbi:hypothetical protein PC128_g20078 [Phytophthora cactorum]|nr:hypothetical protein PC128_g20078 [Phytophthora cactorum]
MGRSRRTPRELKVRLATLKLTYGKRVSDFPRCFFSGATPGWLLLSSGEASGSRGPPRAMPRRGTAPPRTHLAKSLARKSSAEQQSLRRLETAVENSAVEQSVDVLMKLLDEPLAVEQSVGHSAALSAVEQSVETVVGHSAALPAVKQWVEANMVRSVKTVDVRSVGSTVVERPVEAVARQSVTMIQQAWSPQVLLIPCASLLAFPDATRVLVSIFSEITAGDVRQEAGRTQNNAGELLPRGVAVMIEALGPLNEQDIFLDVGAGIGNVLAQVALTTCIGKCIGIEVSSDACLLGANHIHHYANSYPLLHKVTMKDADVRDALLSVQALTCGATIIYANYFLFEEYAKLVVSQELSAMLKA